MDVSGAETRENGRVPEGIRTDNRQLERYLVDRVYKAHERHQLPRNPEVVHNVLLHIAQVQDVAVAIARNATKIPDEYKAAVVYETERYALVHDIGREDDIFSLEKGGYRADNHPFNGARRLIDLGFPSNYADLALDHHGMGLGLSIPGRENYEKLAQEQGVEAVVRKYEEKYAFKKDEGTGLYLCGLPGLAAVVADLSKAYDLPNEHDKTIDPNKPRIAMFSEEGAEALIKRQIVGGVFVEGSAKHQRELLGKNLVLAMIKQLESKYGVNYKEAIDQAQQNWPQSLHKIQGLWASNFPAKQKLAA